MAGVSCASAKSFNCIQSTSSNPTFVCGVVDIDKHLQKFDSLATMTKYLNENLNPKSITYYNDGFSRFGHDIF
ncbi:MAG: hypothetical protein LBB45_06930 [Methanobrevibacter sp.]|nr:hypothetical protein [Candidatus Methanovirga basalitermitum]